MSLIISTLLLASAATAQLTTSLWMPFSISPENIAFRGSVISKDGDLTTLAVTIDDDTKSEYPRLAEAIPATVTIGGTTYFAAETTTTLSGNVDYTQSLKCSAKTAEPEPTCTYSVSGNGLHEVICGEYTSRTEIITTTYVQTYTSDEFGPASTRTFTETYDHRDSVPDYCVSGTTLPEDMLAITETAGWDPYPIVITAGQEKLDATAGASPSTNSAQVTGTASSIASDTASVSAAQSAPTTATGPAPEQTGAAVPMRPMAPALVGLGAAVAAWLL